MGRMGVNLFEAINLCRQQGFDDAQIIVDTVMTVGDTLAEVDPSSYKTAAVNDRNTDIKSYDAIMNDIGWAKDAYPSVQWRYLIMPSSALSANMTTYNAQAIATMISQGQTDAESAVQRMAS